MEHELINDNPSIERDGKQVFFSDHALEQFSTRFKEVHKGSKLNDPLHTASKIFLGSVIEELDEHISIKRLLANRCEPVTYYRNVSQNWRFVCKVEEDKITVLTIERPLFFPKTKKRSIRHMKEDLAHKRRHLRG